MKTQNNNQEAATNYSKTENEFSDNQDSKKMSNVAITKADDQKIEKTGDNMNNLDNTLQKQPDKVGIKQVELNTRLNKLAELNNNIITRWGMSKSDKELLRIDSKANQVKSYGSPSYGYGQCDA